MNSSAEAMPMVREALAALRLRPDLADEFETIDEKLDRFARAIFDMWLLQTGARAGAMQHGTDRAINEILGIRRAARNVRNRLSKLSPDLTVALFPVGFSSVDEAVRSLARLSVDLEATREMLLQMKRNADGHDSKPGEPISIPKRRKPKDPLPSALTGYLAVIYTHLTGRRPARDNRSEDRSEFVRFIGDIFRIFGIIRSADYEARGVGPRRGEKEQKIKSIAT